MFDRYEHRDGDRVHVEQLPHDTADAARLYGEMIDKAEKAVARATVERFGADHQARVVKVESERSFDTQVTTTRLLYSINGQLYDLQLSLDDGARERLTRSIANTIAQQVYEKLSSEWSTKP